MIHPAFNTLDIDCLHVQWGPEYRTSEKRKHLNAGIYLSGFKWSTFQMPGTLVLGI